MTRLWRLFWDEHEAASSESMASGSRRPVKVGKTAIVMFTKLMPSRSSSVLFEELLNSTEMVFEAAIDTMYYTEHVRK